MAVQILLSLENLSLLKMQELILHFIKFVTKSLILCLQILLGHAFFFWWKSELSRTNILNAWLCLFLHRFTPSQAFLVLPQHDDLCHWIINLIHWLRVFMCIFLHHSEVTCLISIWCVLYWGWLVWLYRFNRLSGLRILNFWLALVDDFIRLNFFLVWNIASVIDLRILTWRTLFSDQMLQVLIAHLR